eukprot:scaffold117835_cov66-Phaeocystis_antarctica.AAC.2
MEVAALIAHVHARLLPLASVAQHERDEVLDRKRRDLGPDLDADALRRHGQGEPSLVAPLVIVRVERLFDALLLRASELLEHIRLQVVREVLRGHEVHRALVRLAGAVQINVEPHDKLVARLQQLLHLEVQHAAQDLKSGATREGSLATLLRSSLIEPARCLGTSKPARES